MSLVVNGSICLDTVETPNGGKHEDVLGGSGVYFSAAASFFTNVRVIGVAGEDLPFEHVRFLEGFGVDTTGLEIRKGSKTFRWSCRYHGNMDARDTLKTELNVLGEEPASVPESYKDSQYVFLANDAPRVQRALLERFPKRKLAVADTMDLWINTARDELEALMKEVDGLVLNYDEAELFTGHQNAVAAGKHLLELGPRFVVVKKGEHGALLIHEDGIAAVPAYPVEQVVDPTGAGDSFAGGVMGWLSATNPADPASFESVHAALAYGTVIASFTLEAFSLERLSTLTKEEVLARYDEYKSMLRFS